MKTESSDVAKQIRQKTPLLTRLGAFLALATALAAVASVAACGGGYSGPTSPPVQGGVGPVVGLDTARSISSISPTHVSAGGPDLTVTITGHNFVGKHHVRSLAVWSANGTDTYLGTIYISDTRLSAVVPAALMASPVHAQIRADTGDLMSDSPPAPTNAIRFDVVPAAAGIAVSPASANPQEINPTSDNPPAATGSYATIDVPGGSDTFAVGVNDLGQLVGRYTDADGNVQGYLRNPDGRFETISPPGATFTVAADINDAGDIAGRYLDELGNNHGFLLRQGSFKVLDVPGAVETLGRGIDDRGDITGNFIDPINGTERGFVLNRAGYRTIFFPGTDSTDVWDSTYDGRLVGDWSNTAGVVRGYTWRRGKFTIVDFPRAMLTSVRGINQRDTIVGLYCNQSQDASCLTPLHGFVRTDDGYIQLDVPGAQETTAARINDQDTIVGSYLGADDSMHGYILTGWQHMRAGGRASSTSAY